MKDDIAHHHIA